MSFIIMFLCSLSFSSLCFAQPAFYQFGDSIFDVGNTLNFSSSILPASKKPYGQSFPGYPDGRWSNGRLLVDYYGVILESKTVVAYPSMPLPSSILYGVSFAYAGSAALNSSTLSEYGIATPGIPSFQAQIQNYMDLLQNNCPGLDPSCEFISVMNVFVGPIGASDIIYAYTQGKMVEEIRSLIPLIVNATIQSITGVMLESSIILLGLNFPLGCFPAVINHCNLVALDEHGCVEDVNNIVIYQNQLLSSAIQIIANANVDTTFYVIDYYNFFLTAITHPALCGLAQSTIFEPCCGNGYFELTDEFCGGSNATVCAHPEEYVHWDGINLTQKFYGCLTDYVVKAISLL